MRKAREIHLDGEQKAELGALAQSVRTTHRLAQRCRIVFGAAEGMTGGAIGKEGRVSRQKAARWRARYLQKGLAGLLKDKAGRGRPAKIKAEQKAEVVRRTLEETPEMATQWSTRARAGLELR
jgi:transposase